MTAPAKFRKKPVEITAAQWGKWEARDIIRWVEAGGGRAHLVYRGQDHPLRQAGEMYPHSRERAVSSDAPPSASSSRRGSRRSRRRAALARPRRVTPSRGQSPEKRASQSTLTGW